MSYLSGKFKLKPLFKADAVLPLEVIIKPQRPYNPFYVDFIVKYPENTVVYRSNNNVGSFYAYYDDSSNVGYLTNPRKIYFSVDIDSGIFQALTEVHENGKKIMLMDYQLV
jgi:hypothetical protein